MGRSPCCSKEGLNKGAWTAMEDKILSEYINVNGEGKWRHLPKRAGLKRCGKSCRLRWLNYLRPGIKRGNITNDEEDLIIRLHNLLGNRWSLIAGRLPGRTDNEIKNYWNTNIGRKLQNGSSSSSTQPDQNLKNQDCPYNKVSPSCDVVRTKATRFPKVVALANQFANQNEGVDVVDMDAKVAGDNSIIKVSPSSESDNNDNDNDIGPLDFMADFQMDGNLFSELLKMELPETTSLCLEENGDACNVVEKGGHAFPISSSSCNDAATHLIHWGDSLYEAEDFDFQAMATFMEPGFDWV